MAKRMTSKDAKNLNRRIVRKERTAQRRAEEIRDKQGRTSKGVKRS